MGYETDDMLHRTTQHRDQIVGMFSKGDGFGVAEERYSMVEGDQETVTVTVSFGWFPGVWKGSYEKNEESMN